MSFEQAESDYSQLVQAALDYGYTEDWTKLRTADLSIKELQQVAEKVGYHVNVNVDGSIRNITKDVTAPLKAGTITGNLTGGGDPIGSNINSNLEIGTTAAEANTTFQSTADIAADVAEGATAAEAAKAAVKAGKMAKFTNGVKGVFNKPVTGTVSGPLIAVSSGIKTGKGIDAALYNFAKVMGEDESQVWALNPQSWESLVSDLSDEGLEGIYKWGFNVLFGLSDTGDAQMYVDENAFAYMVAYLQSQGFYTTGSITVDSTEFTDLKDTFEYPITLNNSPFYQTATSGNYVLQVISAVPFAVFDTEDNSYNSLCEVFAYGSDPGTNVFTSRQQPSHGETTPLPTNYISKLSGKYTYKDKTVHFSAVSGGNASFSANQGTNKSKVSTSKTVDLLNKVAWDLIYGDVHTTAGSPDGVSELENADNHDSELDKATDPDSALNILKTLFPELWDNRVEQQQIQPDGSTKTYTYVPLPFPISGEDQAIDSQGASQQQNEVVPKPDPETQPDVKPATESQLWSLIQIITNSLKKPQGMTETEPDPQKQPQANPDATPLNPDPPTNPPDTGTGEPPVAVPPTGSASSLWAIYNPTIPQINDFGAWLWSPNFVDQILKLFNDPMQSIIGLHRVYATPVTGETRTIKVGYLDSGVPSLIVTDQYSTVDCGTVNLREYFGNVLDYDPYTQVQLYLPFVGIVNLDVADVMRSSINIVYHVDVLTGACLAEVKVIRDAAGGTLYQYAGNAAVTMPISSGSYMGIVASIASIAGGVAGTIASGGAMAPMLLGSASSALGSARTKVEHSGGFSGNAGAMGIKKPYLIISRPQAALAKNYQYYIGDPSNTTTTLGSCTGYVQVKECHLENVPATQQELNNIEQILKGGVLI